MSDEQIGGKDDQLVWSMTAGTKLRAVQDVVMEDPAGVRAFTGGLTYSVETMHPVANPPFVTLRNDQHQQHRMNAEHLKKWFCRVD